MKFFHLSVNVFLVAVAHAHAQGNGEVQHGPWSKSSAYNADSFLRQKTEASQEVGHTTLFPHSLLMTSPPLLRLPPFIREPFLLVGAIGIALWALFLTGDAVMGRLLCTETPESRVQMRPFGPSKTIANYYSYTSSTGSLALGLTLLLASTWEEGTPRQHVCIVSAICFGLYAVTTAWGFTGSIFRVWSKVFNMTHWNVYGVTVCASWCAFSAATKGNMDTPVFFILIMIYLVMGSVSATWDVLANGVHLVGRQPQPLDDHQGKRD